MKILSFIALFSAIAVATSQDDACPLAVSRVPSCATSCIVGAAAAANCGQTDYKCLCSQESFEKVVKVGVPCVLKGCGLAGAKGVKIAVDDVCKICAGTAGLIGGRAWQA